MTRSSLRPHGVKNDSFWRGFGSAEGDDELVRLDKGSLDRTDREPWRLVGGLSIHDRLASGCCLSKVSHWDHSQQRERRFSMGLRGHRDGKHWLCQGQHFGEKDAAARRGTSWSEAGSFLHPRWALHSYFGGEVPAPTRTAEIGTPRARAAAIHMFSSYGSYRQLGGSTAWIRDLRAVRHVGFPGLVANRRAHILPGARFTLRCDQPRRSLNAPLAHHHSGTSSRAAGSNWS